MILIPESGRSVAKSQGHLGNAGCGSPLALEASRAFRRSYCGKLGGGGFAAIREADACRPRRTLTLQERAERSESAAAAEAERARAAELERDRAAGGGTGGPRETVRDGGRPVRRHPPAQRCPRGPGERRHRGPGRRGGGAQTAHAKAQAEEEAHRRAVAAADARAERQRRLDARRSHWTRERQAREKYAGRMAEWEAGRVDLRSEHGRLVEARLQAGERPSTVAGARRDGFTGTAILGRGRRHAGRAGRIRGQARR